MSATSVPDASAHASAATPRVRVRRATGTDLSAVVELRLSLLREHPDHPVYGRLHRDVSTRARELFAAQLRSDSEVIFLGEVEAKVVGILRCLEMMGSPLLEPARYGYISSTYVVPSHRRMGVLRAMLATADAWARDRGLDQMRLHNVAGNPGAEGAWGALGFDVVEQVRVRNLPLR
jgi:ribosomal protein S18 acetylase RimI-like enzyme